MFKILRFIIWIVGIVGVSYMVLRYFGYDVNWSYFDANRQACREKMVRCQQEFLANGYNNPDCKLKDCITETVDNSDQLIIKLK